MRLVTSFIILFGYDYEHQEWFAPSVGLVSIKWITDSEIFIECFLSDRKQNIIYDLLEIRFKTFKT